MKCSRWNSLTLFSIIMLQASSGYADIGGVGSPVSPSNGAPQTQNNPIVVLQPASSAAKPQAGNDAKQAASATATATEGKQIFSLEFSQHHLSYDNDLKQAILAAELENPRAREYTVTSIIPAVLNKKDLGNDIGIVYQGNLSDVVSKIGSYGISSSKVHAVNEISDSAQEQFIMVTVK